MTRISGSVLQLASVSVLLLTWHAVGVWRPDWRFFLGSPMGVLQAITQPEIAARLPLDATVTVTQAAIGFTLGTLSGTGLGLILWFSRTAMAVFRPYLVFLASIPIFALGPIFVFWFGTELASKVALVFVATFSLATTQAYQGARSCDANLIRLGVAFGATKSQLLLKLIAPSAFAWVLSGTRINISLALVASVVGEMISSRRGLGNLLVVAEGLYDIDLMLACIAIIAGIAIALNLLLHPLDQLARRGSPEPQVASTRSAY